VSITGAHPQQWYIPAYPCAARRLYAVMTDSTGKEKCKFFVNKRCKAVPGVLFPIRTAFV
jgi:hypothetical protein